ncbi:MAG: serine hydrolase domain-containing protein [Gammaproteobacteria bacterium]
MALDFKKLANVIALFNQQQTNGAFLGGQMVVRYKNEVIVNENIGFARAQKNEQIPVYQNTLFPVYSAGKPIPAIAIAWLEDRALLDIEAPIADLLPEFAAQGKEFITTLDVLTHTAGILIPSSYTLNPEKQMTWKIIVESKPLYPRGTFAYMPLEYGIILSKIVERIYGRSFDEFISKEFATPLQTPALKFGLQNREHDALAHSFWFGRQSMTLYGTKIADNIEESINAKICFDTKNPAFNLITDASSLAGFYEFLIQKGVTIKGKRLLSEQTIEKYTSPAVSGWNKTLKLPLVMGRGFTLGSLLPSAYGWWNSQSCFGHGGLFSSLAFGDHRRKLAVAIVTNGNRSIYDFYRRFIPLSHGIRAAVSKSS